MKLWDWIMEAIVGRSGPLGPSRQDDLNAGGVATLDWAADEPRAVGSERWWETDEPGLTEIAAVPRPDLSPEARALENILISHFDSHDLNLPPLPRVTEKVLQRLSDPSYVSAHVAEDISEDQVIAAAVLRMANSVLYGGRDKITAIHPAVNRLGATALRTLMFQQSLRAATFQKKSADRDLAELVWYRSIAGGCVMRSLSRFTRVDKEDAFMIGLLHDIGNVIVLREVQKQQAVLHYKIDIATFDHLCAAFHQEMGELVAQAWQLPATLKSLIANHHAYPSQDDPLRTERLLIHLTYMINAMIGYAPCAEYDLLNTRAVRDLGLSENPEFEDFLMDLPGLVELHVGSASL